MFITTQRIRFNTRSSKDPRESGFVIVTTSLHLNSLSWMNSVQPYSTRISKMFSPYSIAAHSSYNWWQTEKRAVLPTFQMSFPPS